MLQRLKGGSGGLKRNRASCDATVLRQMVTEPPHLRRTHLVQVCELPHLLPTNRNMSRKQLLNVNTHTISILIYIFVYVYICIYICMNDIFMYTYGRDGMNNSYTCMHSERDTVYTCHTSLSVCIFVYRYMYILYIYIYAHIQGAVPI